MVASCCGNVFHQKGQGSWPDLILATETTPYIVLFILFNILDTKKCANLPIKIPKNTKLYWLIVKLELLELGYSHMERLTLQSRCTIPYPDTLCST